MDSFRVLLLATALVVPAACEDAASVLISHSPCVVGKLISVDIGDSYDDLQVCRLRKSAIIDMITTTVATPVTLTPNADDLTVKFTPEAEKLQQTVARAKQEILDEMKLKNEKLNLSEQAKGQCEKQVFTRQHNSSGLMWDESSEWQKGTHDEYLRYLKTTGQLTKEDESAAFDPQVTTYVDEDPSNWKLPKATSRKLDPPPQNTEIKPPLEGKITKQVKKKVLDSDEESGLVSRSTERKWDSWVEQQLEAYLGHLKGGHNQVQTRAQSVPNPKEKGGKNKAKGKKNKKGKIEKAEEIDPWSKKSFSVVVRKGQDDMEEDPWLKSRAPKKIGQGKKKWQQLRTAKREKGWNEREISEVNPRMAKDRKGRHRKRKMVELKEPVIVDEEVQNKHQIEVENEPLALREEVPEHDLIPAWKIKRLIELIRQRQGQEEAVEPWRSLSLHNQGSQGGARKMIFKNLDNKEGARRRSLFGHKRYWFKRGGRKK